MSWERVQLHASALWCILSSKISPKDTSFGHAVCAQSIGFKPTRRYRYSGLAALIAQHDERGALALFSTRSALISAPLTCFELQRTLAMAS